MLNEDYVMLASLLSHEGSNQQSPGLQESLLSEMFSAADLGETPYLWLIKCGPKGKKFPSLFLSNTDAPSLRHPH